MDTLESMNKTCNGMPGKCAEEDLVVYNGNIWLLPKGISGRLYRGMCGCLYEFILQGILIYWFMTLLMR